MANSTFV